MNPRVRARRTRFQLASVSKQFTAAAVLLLSESGAVSLDDAASRWIERCPASWRSITIRHLLTHTAGLPTWCDLPEIALTEQMAASVELSAFKRAALRSEPGRSWYYSSPGYVLLAHIVQCAADRPYAQFLAERLFSPLGLTSTFAGNGVGEDRLAVGHEDGKVVESAELDVVSMGAGDIWSTAADVLRWDAALVEGSPLNADSADLMFSIQTPVDAPSVPHDFSVDGYGFGWFVGSVLNHDAAFHGGQNAGFRALNLVMAEERLRLVILSNEETTEVDQIAVELLTDLFG
jgi:CubicO group peptidase (beta-lactamase class C family)